MSIQIAFQSNVGELTHTPGTPQTATSTRLGMAQNSSPVIAPVPGKGFVIAFQVNTGNLFISRGVPQAGIDSRFGMMADTNPAIAATRAGGAQIAFHANTGRLLITDDSAAAIRDVNVTLKPNTSPAMTRFGGIVAYQSASGTLGTIVLNPNSQPVDTVFGMASGTSPSIATDYLKGFETSTTIAFQANTGNLFTATGRVREGVDTRLGMMAGTSPSIVYLADGKTLIAFQANVGRLFTTKGLPSQAFDTGFQMHHASSPTIVMLKDGAPLIAFQAPNGNLMTTQGNFSTVVDTQLGMMLGTIPDVDVERTPIPTISSVTPTHAQVGAQIEIIGADLSLESFVFFTTEQPGAFVSSPSTHVSDMKLKTTVPSGVKPGVLLVGVINESGTATSLFVVDQSAPPPPKLPVITSMNPVTGSNLSVVTFEGNNFQSTKEVTINSIVADYAVISDSELRVRVPLLTLSGPFVIKNDAGLAKSGIFVIQNFQGLGSLSVENQTSNDTITVWIHGRNASTGIDRSAGFTLAPGDSTGAVNLFSGAVYDWAATSHAAVAEHNIDFPHDKLDPTLEATSLILNYRRAAATGIDGLTGGPSQAFTVT
jgi:hypothetical protein